MRKSSQAQVHTLISTVFTNSSCRCTLRVGISLLSFVLCTQCARDYCSQQNINLVLFGMLLSFARQRLNEIKHKLTMVPSMMSEQSIVNFKRKVLETREVRVTVCLCSFSNSSLTEWLFNRGSITMRQKPGSC